MIRRQSMMRRLDSVRSGLRRPDRDEYRANLTITGSLATLIWLNMVQRRGVSITAGRFLRLGIVATPVIFLSAVIGLWVSLRSAGMMGPSPPHSRH